MPAPTTHTSTATSSRSGANADGVAVAIHNEVVPPSPDVAMRLPPPRGPDQQPAPAAVNRASSGRACTARTTNAAQYAAAARPPGAVEALRGCVAVLAAVPVADPVRIRHLVPHPFPRVHDRIGQLARLHRMALAAHEGRPLARPVLLLAEDLR